MQSYKEWTREQQKELLLLNEPNGGSTFGGCFCGGPYTDGIPCHHMVAVFKSFRIEGLTATNSILQNAGAINILRTQMRLVILIWIH
jgi:hypothetical protein